VTKNLVSVIGITILTGTTLTTSALGVIKVTNNLQKQKVEVPQVKEMEARETEIPHPLGSTVHATITPSPASTVTGASSVQCAITLFGKQYNVDSLRNTHSGGDVFNCGTDMTAIYQAQHGTDVTRMQPYLITAGGTTGSTNTSNGPTPTPSSNTTGGVGGRGEKAEDKKNEDKQQNEDQKEEEKTHLETFLQKVIHLFII